MTVFVIADLHLGETSAQARRGLFSSPDEMDREIVVRWNRTVSEDDVVHILGDLGKRSRLPLISLLRGTKHLIAGNADDLGAVQRSGIFATVRVARWVRGFLLTHIPVHESQLAAGVVNVHGHLHAATVPDPRYRCVSVEQTNYTPVELRS